MVMRYLGEKEAEDFLENFDFKVVKRVFCKREKDIPNALSAVGLPCVMKVSGKKIVHKNRLGGVNTKIDTYSTALDVFRDFKKIKGSEGVMIQKKLDFKKEFLLGIKKTEDFGHVIVFGAGGTGVEEKKDIAFRVCPLEKDDVFDLIKEVKITKDMGKKEMEKLSGFFMKLCEVVKKYPEVSELDINPFVLAGEGPVVLDSRILFE
ncbi:MAG: acetate--CoA ligase family protein [Nanoarchaeota archaeon]|jgi:hypothetical protein|nr:acetate--CoA ligase family protein [Nanoarchaeota archaeon]